MIINERNLYCYPDSYILINKFNIKEPSELKRVDAEITGAKILNIYENVSQLNFSKNAILNLHKYIFEDLYDWAGTTRKVALKRDKNFFLDYNAINPYLDFLVDKTNSFEINNKDDLLNQITFFYNTFNYIHPFPDGNGRINRVITKLLCRNQGYDLMFSKMDEQQLLDATIKSFKKKDTSSLYALFSQSLEEYNIIEYKKQLGFK